MSRALPAPHATFIERLRAACEADPRFEAVLAAGSLVHGGFDEHSDLDFVIVVEAGAYHEVLASRADFAGSLGSLISAFTGEHVGEPRLLICLYGPPLLHVDLKFVTAAALAQRIEDPAVVFARDAAALARSLAVAAPVWPDMTPDWFEARAWIWLHYAAAKLARGELFEAIGMLGFFREQVLGPMLHRRAGRPQRGIRRVELLGLDPAELLRGTLAAHDAGSVAAALRAAMAAYLALRADAPPTHRGDAARPALLAMLDAAAASAGPA